MVGQPVAVEATITMTGEAGLAQAMVFVLTDIWNDWRKAESAFDRAATWVPTGGSKSGAPRAHKAAQQAAAGNGRGSQKDGVNDDGVATCATPCNSPHGNKHAISGGSRTPVELFLQGVSAWDSMIRGRFSNS